MRFKPTYYKCQHFEIPVHYAHVLVSPTLKPRSPLDLMSNKAISTSLTCKALTRISIRQLTMQVYKANQNSKAIYKATYKSSYQSTKSQSITYKFSVSLYLCGLEN